MPIYLTSRGNLINASDSNLPLAESVLTESEISEKLSFQENKFSRKNKIEIWAKYFKILWKVERMSIEVFELVCESKKDFDINNFLRFTFLKSDGTIKTLAVFKKDNANISTNVVAMDDLYELVKCGNGNCDIPFLEEEIQIVTKTDMSGLSDKDFYEKLKDELT